MVSVPRRLTFLLGATALAGSALAFSDFQDCGKVDASSMGPFGVTFDINGTDEDGHPVFVYYPDVTLINSFPVMIFSHGVTGEVAMYTDAIQRYISHGFIVVFPHVKDPDYDTKFYATDPMGHFTTRGVNYAKKLNEDSTSVLHGKLDLSNMILVGHSMGASATIMAAATLPAGTVKLAYAQHPGICGPFGPPPCLPGSCSTWMPNDFENVSSRMPLILSTATNDGAFWPAPYTAEHEWGCFNKSTTSTSSETGTAFVQFSEQVCQDDGKGGRPDHSRTWSNGGHDCPMKSGSVETPWVIVAAKLYAQLGGDSSSKCHAMLWGNEGDSLRQGVGMEHVVVRAPSASTLVV